MSETCLKKVTVEIPQELLEFALEATGLGIDSTIRLSLALAATHPALEKVRRNSLKKKRNPDNPLPAAILRMKNRRGKDAWHYSDWGPMG